MTMQLLFMEDKLKRWFQSNESRAVEGWGLSTATLVAGALLLSLTATAQSEPVSSDSAVSPSAVVKRTEHRQFKIPLTCSGNTCTYTSTATPNKQRRILERLNCRYTALLPGIVNFTTGDLKVMTGSTAGATVALLPAFVSSVGSVVVDQTMDIEVKAGQTWVITLGLNVGIAQGAGCTVIASLEILE